MSEGTITDQQVITAAKNSVVAALNNIAVADGLSPAQPAQLEKLATIAAALIKNNIIPSNDILQIFNIAGGRRRKLLAGYVLLKSGYKSQPFLGSIQAFASQPTNTGALYKALAQACLAAI